MSFVPSSREPPLVLRGERVRVGHAGRYRVSYCGTRRQGFPTGEKAASYNTTGQVPRRCAEVHGSTSGRLLSPEDGHCNESKATTTSHHLDKTKTIVLVRGVDGPSQTLDPYSVIITEHNTELGATASDLIDISEPVYLPTYYNSASYKSCQRLPPSSTLENMSSRANTSGNMLGPRHTHKRKS